MDDARSTSSATPRRDFLRVIALAPALAAGCAATRGAAPGPSADPPRGPGVLVAAASDERDPLAPLRGFPLSPDAEPAFVFRAAPARPGA